MPRLAVSNPSTPSRRRPAPFDMDQTIVLNDCPTVRQIEKKFRLKNGFTTQNCGGEANNSSASQSMRAKISQRFSTFALPIYCLMRGTMLGRIKQWNGHR